MGLFSPVPTQVQIVATDEVSIGELVLDARIDLTKPPKKPPVALSMGTHQNEGGQWLTPWGTYGNISAISGPSKSRKTFFKTALVAGYLGASDNGHFEDIRGHDNHDRIVLDIDTEQSPWHVYMTGRRVTRMLDRLDARYHCYSFRPMNHTQRVEALEHLIFNTFKDKRIGLVCIDGVADLVPFINDEEAARNVTQKLMTWSTERDCHILNVIHNSHGTKKPTGHIGSEILKKCETIAFAEKAGEVTRIMPDYTRNYGFQGLEFEVVDGLPVQQIFHNI